MRIRTARKIVERVSHDFKSVCGYKRSTLAKAVTTLTGVYCKPRDGFIASGLIHLIQTGELQPYIVQSNTELAS